MPISSSSSPKFLVNVNRALWAFNDMSWKGDWMCFVKCTPKFSQDLFPETYLEVLGMPENSSLNRNVQTDKTLIWPGSVSTDI